MGTNVKNKRQRVIITDLEKQGCVTRETKKGVMIRFPNGDSMTMTGSESDHRAEMNTRARVLRAGLTWYFDRK